MTTLEELERRVQALEDLAAIKRLKAQYGELADDRYLNGVVKSEDEVKAIAGKIAELFTDDAVFENEHFGISKGREGIYKRFAEPLLAFAFHYFVEPLITIEGDRARARWYLLAPATVHGNTAVWMAGFEDDEYVKTNGQWRISHTKLTLVFMTPYDEGWDKRRMAD